MIKDNKIMEHGQNTKYLASFYNPLLDSDEKTVYMASATSI